MTKPSKIGRLALRHEGRYWNAYYADQQSMDGAILLGSIAMAAVVSRPPLKRAFMELMRNVVTAMLAGVAGDVTWPDEPVAAPEHERSGHA